MCSCVLVELGFCKSNRCLVAFEIVFTIFSNSFSIFLVFPNLFKSQQYLPAFSILKSVFWQDLKPPLGVDHA